VPLNGYRPYPVPGFARGLDLRSQPDTLDPSAAVDCLNVEFSEAGAVRQRSGYARLNPTALTNQPDSLGVFYKVDGTKRLLVGNGNRVDALDTNGASVANITTPTASPHFFARYGSPAGERIYMANGTDQVRRYDGTSFSNPAGLAAVTGRHVAVWGNRLVVARQGGTTAGVNPSSVRFSAAGDPEDFTTTVYVDLHPGDGEEIMGMAVFGEQLFVFKQSKFFVFFGVQTDASSAADPQWQAVEAGVGLVAPRAVCTSPQGVFFLGRDGVYKTTGRAPEVVSQNVEPLFTGGTSAFFRSDSLNMGEIDNAAMTWHRERIYLAVTTGVASANDRMLVHDPRYGWWSLYDIPATSLASWRPGNDEELVFGNATSGSKFLGRHSDAYATDTNSTAVSTVANYVQNPSAETNTTDYSLSTGTLTQSAVKAKYGTYSLRCNVPTAGASLTYAIPGTSGLAPSLAYTASLWISSNIGESFSLALVELTSAGATVATTSDTLTVAGTAFQRVDVTAVFGATGVDARLVLTHTGTTTPVIFYVDGVQLEQAASASTYADGDQDWLRVGGHCSCLHDARNCLARIQRARSVSRWRSGWLDMGDPNVKTVRETTVWGEGQATFRLTTDFDDSGVGAVQTWTASDFNDLWTDEPTDIWTDAPDDVWGGRRAIKPRLVRQARRGTVFSTEFSNDEPSVGWAVHRMDHGVRETRNPTTVATDSG
jgi:hypothetical protein